MEKDGGLLLGQRGHSVADGVDCQFQPIRYCQLIEYRSKVVAYGLFTDEQFFRDPGGPESLGYERNNLTLPGRQRVDAGPLRVQAPAFGIAMQLLEYESRRAAIDPHLARSYLSDGLEQRLSFLFLHDNARSPKAYGAPVQFAIAHSGKDENAYVFVIGNQLGNDIQAAADAQVQVEQYDIGDFLSSRFERFIAPCSLGNHLHVPLVFDQHAQPLAHYDVIVDQEDSD